MIVTKYDRGGTTKPKYSKARGKEQSPEERLSDAIASQGRGSKDLMYMLSAMRSPTALERKAETFDPSLRFTPRGRAFEKNRKVMYQRPSDVEGKYEGSGGLPTRGDVRKITGGRGYIGSRGETEVAKMLRDPAIIRYFMDLYGEAGKKKRAKTTSLGGGSRKEDDCQPDRTGKIPVSCKGQKAAYDG